MRFSIPVALLVSLLGAPADADCTLPEKERNAIAAVPGEYRDAWFAPDAKEKVMALMTNDATILPHHGVAPLSGPEAIRGFWFPENSPPTEILEFSMKALDAGGCGPVGYVYGTQSLQWRTRGESKITFNAGTFLMVLQKESGQWKIHRLMWDDPPNRAR